MYTCTCNKNLHIATRITVPSHQTQSRDINMRKQAKPHAPECTGAPGRVTNIRALIIRIGFWAPYTINIIFCCFGACIALGLGFGVEGLRCRVLGWYGEICLQRWFERICYHARVYTFLPMYRACVYTYTCIYISLSIYMCVCTNQSTKKTIVHTNKQANKHTHVDAAVYVGI